MASAKLATLIIRTLAKPISSQIKEQVRQHERFRGLCVNLAQFMYRSEVKLRTNILGEPAKHIRPLSEAKAIDNGANALAEGFLFTVAAALIIGETWRSSRNSSKRRDSVDDQLEDLGARLTELTTRVDTIVEKWDDERSAEKQRNDELARILERVVEIGLRGGWAEFQDTPVQLPRIQLAPHLRDPSSPSSVTSSSSSAPAPAFSESLSSSLKEAGPPTPNPPAPIAQSDPVSVFVSGSVPQPALTPASASAPVLTAGSASAPVVALASSPEASRQVLGSDSDSDSTSTSTSTPTTKETKRNDDPRRST